MIIKSVYLIIPLTTIFALSALCFEHNTNLVLKTNAQNGKAEPSVSEANRVLQLDGDGDYVQLPSDIFNHLDEATIEAWLKWEKFGYYSQPFGFGSAERWKIMVVNNVGKTNYGVPHLQFYIYTSSNKLHLIRVDDILRLHQWFHIAAVSGKSGMQLYLNGVLVGENDYTGSFSDIQNDDLNYLGKSQWTMNDDFKGQLDEIRIWEVARTGRQIRDSMFKELAGNEYGLVSLFNFDSGDARDSSENGYDGILFGDARCIDGAVFKPALTGLNRPSVLSGRVFDDERNPLSNARVRLEQNGVIIKETRADASGNYKIVIYPNSEPYDLCATWYEKGDWQIDFHLRQGERHNIDLTLRQVISISGTLLTFDGKPHTSVSVQMVQLNESTKREQVVITTLSDEVGEYRFINLKPGKYLLRCYTGDYVYYGEQGQEGKEGTRRKNKDDVTRNTQHGRILHVERDKSLENINFRLAPFKKGTWRTYTYLHGLASNEINDIHQDADGSMWLATADGICRYDGNRFLNLTQKYSLTAQRVNTIYRSSDNMLWFGTYDGNVFRYDGERFFNFTKENEMVQSQIWCIAEEPDSVLWFGTERGVLRYDGREDSGGFIIFTTQDGLPYNVVRTVYRDCDGVTWVGTSKGLARGICPENSQRDGKQFTTLLNNTTNDIHRDNDGVLWVGTSNGVFRYDGKKFLNLTTKNGLIGNEVYDIDQDADGFLWFGTENGVSRYDGKGFINFTTKDGLVNNSINAIHCVSDGVICFGTKGGGISRYDSRSIIKITTADGLLIKHINPIYSDFDGALWFGTEGGVSGYDSKGFTNWTTQHGLAENRIHDIHQSLDGILWFASSKNISQYNGEKFDILNGEDDLAGIFVEAIHGSPDGTIWLGTHNYSSSDARVSRVVYPFDGLKASSEGILRDGKRFEHFSKEDGFAGYAVNSIHGTPNGVLWFGTLDGGASRYDGKQFTNFTIEDGLASNRIWSVYCGLNGIVWFGTEDGVSRYDGNQFLSLGKQNSSPPLEKGGKGGFTNFTEETRLGYDRILSIYGSSDGLTWFGTYSGGAVGYDGSAFTSLDIRDGLADNAVYAVYEDSEGCLWFGTSNGITRYKRSLQKPSISIVSVQTDKRYENLMEIPPITAGNRVTIEYQSIDFKTISEKQQYRYRIYESGRNGLEIRPYVVTKEAALEWIPKESGEYIFEIQAIDRDLNYSEPSSVTMKIIPPWYLNGWIAIPSAGAILALLISSTAFGWRYFIYRRESQRLRERMFEQEKRARADLEAKNTELESALKQAEWGVTTIRGLAHNLKNSTLWIFRYCDSIKSEHFSKDDSEKIQRLQDISGRIVQNFKRLFEATGNPRYRLFNLASIMNVLSLQVIQENPLWKTKIQIDRQYENQLDIIADREKLTLALRDLIFNACEAMEEKGGTLTIEITDDAEQVVIEIQDTGKGIPESDLEKVFNAQYTSKAGGTGLGLWIAKQIIEEIHQGRISISSQEGVGTTIAIRLPQNGNYTRYEINPIRKEI